MQAPTCLIALPCGKIWVRREFKSIIEITSVWTQTLKTTVYRISTTNVMHATFTQVRLYSSFVTVSTSILILIWRTIKGIWVSVSTSAHWCEVYLSVEQECPAVEALHDASRTVLSPLVISAWNLWRSVSVFLTYSALSQYASRHWVILLFLALICCPYD